MDSASLEQFGFRAWARFNTSASESLISAAPTCPGVYVIRCLSPFTRKNGSSDILYVGSAGNRDGLQMRLRQYFHPGPTQDTNHRLLTRCGNSTDYQVSYVTCATSQEACGLETALLDDYRAEHLELPPENRV